VAPVPDEQWTAEARRREAERFLLALDEGAESFCFQTFDDDKQRRDKRLARTLHGALDDVWDQLERLNAEGAGVFVAVNAVAHGAARRASSVERVRAVFADFDPWPQEPPQFPLEPHLIVESSPGRRHCYWLVDDLPLGAFRAVQAGIAARHGSDRSVIDLPRVMRLPGFWHCKAEPAMTRILHASMTQAWVPDAVLEAWPPPAEPKQQQTAEAAPGDSRDATDADRVQARKIAWSAAGRTHDDPTASRHRECFRIGTHFRRDGLPLDASLIDLALGEFERLMRAESAGGARAPLDWDHERKAVRDGYARAVADGDAVRAAAAARQMGTQREACAGGGSPSGNVVQGQFAGVDWQGRLMRNDRGQVKTSAFNVRLILENDPDWHGCLAWCEFSHRVVLVRLPPLAHASRGEWEDADDTELRFWLAERWGIEPRHGDIADAVLGAARANPVHPVRQYLNGLVWDGEPRLRSWLSVYLGAGTDAAGNVYDQDEEREARYHELAGTMFLISAVARVRRPGAKADHVLILEGEQGRGKSTSLRVLFGADWFTDSPLDLNSKDSMEMLRGLWGVELAELDSLNKADAARAKAFFSRMDDRFRMPYGHRTTRALRQCVFAGSTNQRQYLKDPTGARRYWPVSIGDVDVRRLKADRDQLWAEADALYWEGHRWWPAGDEVELFAEIQDARTESDAWESLIATYLRDQVRAVPPQDRGRIMVTSAAIMSEALNLDPSNMRKPEQTRIGSILHQLGWQPTRPLINGERARGYYRPGARYLERINARQLGA